MLQQGREAVDRAGRSTENRSRAGVRRGGVRLFATSTRPINRAGHRVPRRHGEARDDLPERHRGRESSTRCPLPRGVTDDKTFTDSSRPARILEKLIAVSRIIRAGALHHSRYDVPPLADRALEAARRYATIAPSAPHALHMPSHTFTRLGYWQDSIDTNIGIGRSREARGLCRRRAARDGLPRVRLSADRAGPKRATASRGASGGPVRFDPTRLDRPRLVLPASSRSPRFRPATRSNAAPGPTRPSSSRTRASLRTPKRSPTSPAPSARRAPATSPTVRSAIEALTRIKQQLTEAKERILGRAGRDSAPRRDGMARVRGTSRGRGARGNAGGRRRARIRPRRRRSRQDRWRRARTARRDALVDEQPAEARKEFEATLKKEPNRFRAVYGAAHAASLIGDRPAAQRYFAQLLKICEHADQPVVRSWWRPAGRLGDERCASESCPSRGITDNGRKRPCGCCSLLRWILRAERVFHLLVANEYHGLGPVLHDNLRPGVHPRRHRHADYSDRLLREHPLGSVDWPWFVLLSFMGGLGFSLPLYYWLNVAALPPRSEPSSLCSVA